MRHLLLLKRIHITSLNVEDGSTTLPSVQLLSNGLLAPYCEVCVHLKDPQI